MLNYNTSTKQELIDAQNSLAAQTGENIGGVLGGLPVASQNQEFFAVFDEAGSTGPEIIDKTQFRITYLVNSNLETSKPVEGSPGAFNMTQNFEKGANCKVRADNATVLNQNLTGEQSIYDVGTLQLVSTTEYGTRINDYATTMSFDSTGGTIIGDAQDLSSVFRRNQSDGTNNRLTEQNGGLTVQFSVEQSPISQSSGQYDWVEGLVDSNTTYEFVQSTVAAGTRVRLSFSAEINVLNVPPVGGSNTVLAQIIREDNFGNKSILAEETYTVINSGQIKEGSLNFSNNINGLTSEYTNFNPSDKAKVVVTKQGESSTSLTINAGQFSMQQETPAGEVIIPGVNAATASYWSGFNTISGSGIDSNDANLAFSILTASAQFTTFLDGNYIQRIPTSSVDFDPNNDGNVFNPIQIPLEFKTGDEIRFEYNANKVHKVIKTETSLDGLKVFIKPSIDTQILTVDNALGTQLNHFTHYRIQPDGGYLIVNKVKNNEAGIEQAFKGIITPQYPTEALSSKEDQLIYDLKQAGIIET